MQLQLVGGNFVQAIDESKYFLLAGRSGGQIAYGDTEEYGYLVLGATNQEEITKKGVIYIDDGTPLRLARIPASETPPSGPGSLSDLEGSLIYRPYDNPDPTSVQGSLLYHDGLGWVTVEGVVEDRIPPLPPSGILLSTGTMNDGTNRSWVDIVWDPNTEYDLNSYIILRKEAEDDRWESIAWTIAGPTGIKEKYRDVTVDTSSYYWYGLIASDYWGNFSDIAEASQNPIQAGDETAPDSIVDLSGIAYGRQAIFTWTEPVTTTDYWKINVYRNDDDSGPVLGDWKTATKVGEVPAGVQRFEYYRSDIGNEAADTDRFFFQAVDRANNVDVVGGTGATSYPPYTEITFNGEVPTMGTTLITTNVEPNENGWFGGPGRNPVQFRASPILPTGVQLGVDVTVDFYIFAINSGAPTFSASDTYSYSSPDTGSSFITARAKLSNGFFTEPDSYIFSFDSTDPAISTYFALKERGTGWASFTWNDCVDALSDLWRMELWKDARDSVSGGLGTFATASKIGSFLPGAEIGIDPSVSDYTNNYYWLVGVDKAGNSSTEKALGSAIVAKPADIVIELDVDVTPNARGWYNSDITITPQFKQGAGGLSDGAVLEEFYWRKASDSAGAWNTLASGGSITLDSTDETAGETIQFHGKMEDSYSLATAPGKFTLKGARFRYRLDQTPPSAPTDLTANASIAPGSIKLTWTNGADPILADSTAGSGLWKTEIQRAPDSGGAPGTWETIDTIRADEQVYFDADIIGETTYWYRIRQIDIAENESSWSSQVSSLSSPTPRFGGINIFTSPEKEATTNGWFKSAVTFTAAKVGYTDVTVADVEYCIKTGGSVATPPGSGEWISNSGLYTKTISADTLLSTIWFRFLFTNGEYSVPASYVFKIDVTDPTAGVVGSISASKAGVVLDSITSGSDATSGIWKMEVLRDTSGGGDFPAIHSPGATFTTFTDVAVVEGQDYFYKIRYWDYAGNTKDTTTGYSVGVPVNDDTVILKLSGVLSNGWYGPDASPSITLTGTLNSDTGSLIASDAWRYRIDEGPWVIYNGTTLSVSLTLASYQGEHKIEAYAFMSDGSTTQTAVKEFKVDITAPGGPSSLSLANTTRGISLSWVDGTDTDPGGGIAYSGLHETRIYRYRNSDGTPTLASARHIGTVPAGTLVYSDPTVEDNTTYTYYVTHVDAAGNETSSGSAASASLRTQSPEVQSAKNYLNNGSFETKASAAASSADLLSWEGIDKTGNPASINVSSSGTTVHGDSYVILTGNYGLIQRGINVYRYDDQNYISLQISAYAKSPTGSQLEVRVQFKDSEGENLGSVVVMNSASLSSSQWKRASGNALGDNLFAEGKHIRTASDPPPSATTRWIIGSGGDYYSFGAYKLEVPEGAKTFDISFFAYISGTVYLDAVMVEECTADGHDVNNSSQYTPTVFADSRTLNTDRVNGWFGRFGEISARIMRTGRLEGESNPNTYFDLDEGKIVLDAVSSYPGITFDTVEISDTAIVRYVTGPALLGDEYNNFNTDGVGGLHLPFIKTFIFTQEAMVHARFGVKTSGGSAAAGAGISSSEPDVSGERSDVYKSIAGIPFINPITVVSDPTTGALSGEGTTSQLKFICDNVMDQVHVVAIELRRYHNVATDDNAIITPLGAGDPFFNQASSTWPIAWVKFVDEGAADDPAYNRNYPELWFTGIAFPVNYYTEIHVTLRYNTGTADLW